MRAVRLLVLLFCSVCLFWASVACTEDDPISIRLKEVDSLLSTDPVAALDSLKKIDAFSLNSQNKAYFGLLQTIAQHKNYVPFESDSLITASRAWYEKRNQDPHNLARAFFYNGVVVHSLNMGNEKACLLIQQALAILDQYNIKDDKLTALANAFLGRINSAFEQNLAEAAVYFQNGIDAEQRLENHRNLILDYSDLLVCVVKMGDRKKAASIKRELDSVMAAHPTIKLENPNNAKSIFFLSADNDLDSALFYCLKWNPHPKDIGAKENMIAAIYRQKGRPDSAIAYEQKALMHCRVMDTLSRHVYYRHMAEDYLHLGMSDSSAHYARMAYEDLHKYVDRRTEKRILELERQYDIATKDAELERVRHHRGLLSLVLVISLLLVGGLVVLLLNREQKLRSERITRSFVQASAKTHQNTLSQLKTLAAKRKSATAESLQARAADIATDLRRGFAQNFAEAIRENKGSLSARQRDNLEKITGDRSKVVFILSELGYKEEEIAQYTCTSVDSVRVTINNNRKAMN